MQPVAVIQIAMMPNGEIQIQFQGQGRVQFNAMMTTAMQDMVEKFKEAEGAPKIAVAPPGLKL